MIAEVGLTSPPFTFEHEELVTEDEFLRRNSGAERGTRTWRGWVRLLLYFSVAVVLLFSPYTFSIGILAILIALLGLTASRWITWANRRSYNEYRHAHGPQVYGVSQSGFWIRTDVLKAEATWSNLVVWDEHQGVFKLSGSGMPPLYLPVDQMRAAGVYDGVVSLARANGRKFER